VLPLLGHGPFWTTDEHAFIGDCQRWWLPTLTLIGNFYGDLSYMCLGHTWY